MTLSLRSKGDRWNESEDSIDPITLRSVRRYTNRGLFNTTPTYHTNIAFTSDGKEFVFARGSEEGQSAVFKASVESGEITQLIDPVDGIGHWASIQVKMRSRYGDGKGISGPAMCLAPKSKWLAYYVGRSLRLVHLDTLEEKVLIEDLGIEWMAGVISINPSETHCIVPLKPAHPDYVAGREQRCHYNQAFTEGGMRMRLLEFSFEDGTSRIVYEEEGMGCAHCPHSPVDDDLVIIDRDFPGETPREITRNWILHLPTGQKTELRPQNRHRFQTHTAWTPDGKRIVYHGRAYGGGWFIGAMERDGTVIREWAFPQDYYGHVSVAPDRPAIVLDGNLTEGQLLWLYYDQEQPRVEIIAGHHTDWKGCPGQLPHPHPHTDPTCSRILFNVCRIDRTDVQTVEL